MQNQNNLVVKKYSYAEALEIAEAVLAEMRPHCVRAEIAGSIRRKKALVKDIEIVAISRPYSSGGGLASVVNKWEKVKGGMEYGKTKYTQRILPSGIKLDLFLCDESNWGSIFAIRTGSADYSHEVLAKGWVRNGFRSKGGYLHRDSVEYKVPEERDLFKLAGVPYVEPEKRNLEVNRK